MNDARSAWAEAAARILCEEQLTDYGLAKRKAAARLGLHGAAPDNRQVQQALIEYQRLFGGAAYREHLAALRRTGVRALKLLAEFDARLVGGALSGAVTQAHRAQVHVFADAPEALDFFLHDQRIIFETDERNYRSPDGRELRIPLLRFEGAEAGVDVAVFEAGSQPRAPINPADGRPYQRLNLREAQALAEMKIP